MKTWIAQDHKTHGDSIELSCGEMQENEDCIRLYFVTTPAPQIGDIVIDNVGIKYKIFSVTWAGKNPGDLYFVKVRRVEG